jgi:hypothetical protein
MRHIPKRVFVAACLALMLGGCELLFGAQGSEHGARGGVRTGTSIGF